MGKPAGNANWRGQVSTQQMNKTNFDFSVSLGAVAKFGMKEEDYDRIDDKPQRKKCLLLITTEIM